jgi:SLBB domain
MKYFLILFLLLLSFPIFSQDENYQLGLNPNQRFNNQGALFDYSDPSGLNIKVSVWGYVKYPGRYVIPLNSDINDLISYAGGISDDSKLDDIRLYRVEKDSSQKLYKFDYNDLWWNENLHSELDLSKMNAGDILIIPGKPRLYIENYISLALGVVTTLVSIATLIITINK